MTVALQDGRGEAPLNTRLAEQETVVLQPLASSARDLAEQGERFDHDPVGLFVQHRRSARNTAPVWQHHSNSGRLLLVNFPFDVQIFGRYLRENLRLQGRCDARIQRREFVELCG